LEKKKKSTKRWNAIFGDNIARGTSNLQAIQSFLTWSTKGVRGFST